MLNEIGNNGDRLNKFLSVFRQQAEKTKCLPEAELFRQAEALHNIYLIEHGIVRLVCGDENGCEIIVGIRSVGDLLGAAGVITQNLAPATAISVTECMLYRLPVSSFLSLMKSDTGFSHAITQAISWQYYKQTMRLARLGTATARANLAHLLLQFIPMSEQNQSGSIRLLLPYSKTMLAKLLAVTTVHLSRLLRELKTAGIICENKGWIYVQDIQRLREETQ